MQNLPVGLPLGPPPSATQRLGARTARTDVQISWPQWISERLLYPLSVKIQSLPGIPASRWGDDEGRFFEAVWEDLERLQAACGWCEQSLAKNVEKPAIFS